MSMSFCMTKSLPWTFGCVLNNIIVGKSTLSRLLLQQQSTSLSTLHNDSNMNKNQHKRYDDTKVYIACRPQEIGWVSTELHLLVLFLHQQQKSFHSNRNINDTSWSSSCLNMLRHGISYDTASYQNHENDRHDQVTTTRMDDDMIETVVSWLHLSTDIFSTNRSFTELCQGEQKLLLIASAILKTPQILILDEPLQGKFFWFL
jgi:ABC-type molybdenum transport system ATPase subunit/photorepair protein PhrA